MMTNDRAWRRMTDDEMTSAGALDDTGCASMTEIMRHGRVMPGASQRHFVMAPQAPVIRHVTPQRFYFAPGTIEAVRRAGVWRRWRWHIARALRRWLQGVW